MKKVSVSELKTLKADEIKNGPSFMLTADGELIAFVVVGTQSEMSVRIQSLASQADVAREESRGETNMVSSYDYKVVDMEMLDVAGPMALTAAYITSRIKGARINVQDDAIRATWDGSTTPVSGTTGELWQVNSTHTVMGKTNLENLQFARETSTAKICVSYLAYDDIV